MLIKRSTLLFGVFAIFALSACESEKQEQVEVNPTYDPATNTVRTEFVFNVASSAEGQPTKTTAEFVQHNKPFLGMTGSTSWPMTFLIPPPTTVPITISLGTRANR